ncbi:MAG: hypothetical protein WEF86_08695 [Gemmatimonadota bacterium]
MRRTARTRIDIAIGAERLTVVARHGAAVHTAELELPAGGDIAAALPALFAEVRARLEAAFGDVGSASVSVALLPPLAETRLLQLPPLRNAEAATVVRRDAGRWFASVPAPRISAVHLQRARRGQAAAPVVAAAAAGPLVDAVLDAAEQAGWGCGAIAPAHAAWIAAAHVATGTIVALHDGIAHVIQLRGGAAVVLRRIPADAIAEITGAVVETGAVVVFAPAAGHAILTRALAAADRTVAGPALDAAAAAAQHAHEAGLGLVPSSMAAVRRESERRLALRLAAAALIVFASSAGLELWGAQRELDAVRRQRAGIRAQVGPLLAAHDSVERLDARVAAIESLDRAVPRWTGALFELAMLLPPESHVTRLHATGDTLRVDAQGERAGAALQALRGASTLQEARLVGAVDRELDDGATALERFRISARLAPRPEGNP